MSYYYPDKFSILKITSPTLGILIYKVLGGWNGSFTTGESWRLNSGIESVKVQQTPEYLEYEFYGYSGSVYNCADITEGFTSMSYNALQDYIEKVKGSGVSIELITLKDFLNEFTGEIQYE